MIQVEIDEDVFLPRYKHLLESECDVNFLWGGRDSGKSHFIAQKMIVDAMTEPYFRCILVKKTYESIKDAQFQAIKDIVNDWGLESIFNFKESPLEIHCINGNKFIARGCDKPEKLKSIANPSHVWIEEGNQLTQQDYIILSTTLRTNKGKVQQWFSFNPEPEENYLDFWLYKDFFNVEGQDIYSDFIREKKVKLPTGEESVIKYSSTHSVYTDNPYCTSERRALLEDLQNIDPYYYTVFTLGKWGTKTVGGLFAFAFSRDRHCYPVEVDNNNIVYLSFDFNRNPITCAVIQNIDEEIRVIEQIKLPNSNIYQMCDYIGSNYLGNMFIVTGDATGRNSSALVTDNINYYTIIQKELNLSIGQIKVPSINPKMEDNQVLVNAILSKKTVKIDPLKASALIYDLENVRMNADGTILKRDRTDITQQADCLDCFVGETLIETLSGLKRIDEIEIGEKVLTRKGYQNIIDKWDSFADVFEFEFTDGNKVICTKDHKFYVDSFGFIPIFDIFKQNLSICKKSNSTTIPSQSIKIKSTTMPQLRAKKSHYTDSLMNIILEKSRKDIIYITLTETNLITLLKTLNVLKQKNIYQNTQRCRSNQTVSDLKNWQKQEENMQVNGMDQKLVLNGINNTQKTSDLDTVFLDKKTVNTAEKHLTLRTSRQNSVIIIANQHLEENCSVKVKSAVYIGKRTVYDITVENEHEFFANGILVHNCFRYYLNTFHRNFIKLREI